MNVQTANTYKLKVKDIITVVLLALINVVIFFAGSFLYVTPITILLMPVAYSLVEGIIFFMIGAKVKKRGAILIYCFVRGVLGSFLPYIILYILAGLIAELSCGKLDTETQRDSRFPTSSFRCWPVLEVPYTLTQLSLNL